MPFLARLGALVLLSLTLLSSPATAQENNWLQIEAQPDLPTALDRARAYAALFDGVQGFKAGKWYAVVLGPMTREKAGQELLRLRAEALIPRDSFITDGAAFGAAFWPPEGATPAAPEAEPEAPAEPAAPEVTAAPEPEPEPAETLAQSRAAEDALTRDEKKALQVALQWFGFYQGQIDGAYGKGTRGSFAAWQEAKGHEPTGVLSTDQRAALLAAEAEEKAIYGFDTVTEAESGIEATLPMGLVAFEGYEPPFVQFAPRAAGGPRLMLISEPGDAAALAGLYDILTSMQSIPAGGTRDLGETEFTLTGADATTATHAWARVEKGMVKGYVLTWTPAEAAKLTRMAEVMQASFRSIGDKALDPGLVPLDEAARAGMITGLEPRRPAFSRSGTYVSADGQVLTRAEGLQACREITLEGGAVAALVAQDAQTGTALLKPVRPLAPRAFAAFLAEVPRKGTEIIVTGFAYADRLSAPVLTFGQIESPQGLSGEAAAMILTAPVLDGDQGGPVLLSTGEVAGLLTGPSTDPAKALPPGTAIAAAAPALSAFLAANGLTPAVAGAAATSTDALTRSATDMTVKVSCWN